MSESAKEHLLPGNEPALDALVQEIAERCGVPVSDEMYEDIATAIMHLPPNQAHTDYNHFFNVAWKGMAQRTAYKKLMEFHEKRKAKAEEEKKQAALSLVPQESNAASVEPVQNA